MVSRDQCDREHNRQSGDERQLPIESLTPRHAVGLAWSKRHRLLPTMTSESFPSGSAISGLMTAPAVFSV
jgi:hypothetical protein